MSKKIKHLVVDTTAFIKAANLQDIAESVYTIQEVIDEITNDRQRRKLVVLPYDLQVKDVFVENIKFVTDFAKKTGDYTSLSATDIKVLALTYQIEKEKVGTEHLKIEPTMQKTVKVTGIGSFNLHPQNASENQEKETVKELQSLQNSANVDNNNSNKSEDSLKDVEDDKLANEIAEQIKNMDLADGKDVEELMAKVSNEEEPDDEDTESEENSDSDGGDWITPGNLSEKTREMDAGQFEDKNVEVACITSDFAMQNVLKQIGLNVTAIDGRVIKQLRTFIFRCTTCFKTTSVMTKLFCPKCGHATLKKVGVSIDDEGNQHIHINGRKPLTARGKRFSLPTPRGGQHFQYPILTEDQHIHKRFATKMARNKTNALDPDYIAGFSPFVMKDVNSKSAVLGVRANKQDVKYWMKNYSKGKKK
ncbi:RNA-binding protein NOB1 [Plodia interpunctella]|uniref:RNA-binding protein NOB1 n=1 Tax=Plodia interpunctella TaxID=58824 RepID=UPI002368D845|nr:RNA-binding protein NOB1 [Plodia interpunctella]